MNATVIAIKLDKALLDWLKPVKDENNKYAIANDHALAEANAVINAHIQAAAVGTLPGLTEEPQDATFEEMPF